jgi:hypothetical protein
MISPAREPIERNVGDIAAVNTASDQGAFQSRHFNRYNASHRALKRTNGSARRQLHRHDHLDSGDTVASAPA